MHTRNFNTQGGMYQTVQNDLGTVMDFTKKAAVNSAGIYAVSMLPDFTNNQPSMVMRNGSRGFAWYLASEIGEEIVSQDSNFRNFTNGKTMLGIKNLVDDTVFYGASAAVIEMTRIDVPVVNGLSSVVSNPVLATNLAIGVLLTGSQLVWKNLEKMGWRTITNTFNVL
jgi:hypothetical protein